MWSATTEAMAKLKRREVIMLAAITCACAIAIAACGSSGHSAGAASSDSSVRAAELRVSECMRSHGVPNFPDPSTGGGGGFNLNGTGISPQSPALRSAQQTCFKLLRGGSPFTQHKTAQAMAQDLRISECMRRHRVSGFPDPTVKPPSPNPSEYSAVEDTDGAVLAVPSTIDTSSPVFRQAAAACGFQ
jgi:hypothetical protein